MDNNDLMQISALLDKQSCEIKQFIKDDIRSNNLQIAEMIEQQTHEINLKLENEVTKRIDALVDGYKLCHEKQYELEREVERIKIQLDEIRTHIDIAV